MRVPAHVARAVSRGEATTLRVPVDTRTHRHKTRKGRTVHSRPFRPIAGDRLPLHATDTPITLHVDIAHVERGPLGHLTAEQARHAGYPTPARFEQAWVLRHDADWLTAQLDYLRSQGEPEDDVLATLPAWATARYAHRWAERVVWVLTVTPVHDMPLLLAPAARPKHSEHGYVNNRSAALPDEPEAVPLERLDRRWTTGAGHRHTTAKRERTDTNRRLRELLSVEQRMVAAVNAAKRNEVDVSAELWLLKRTLRENRPEPAVRSRLERVERVAYRDEAA